MDKQTLYAQFNQSLIQLTGELKSHRAATEKTVKEVTNILPPTKAALTSILDNLKEYSKETQSAKDLLSIKEKLSKIVEEKRQSRNVAREARLQSSSKKHVSNDKLVKTKEEIEKVQELNSQLDAQLQSDSQLPLILKLMSNSRTSKKDDANDGIPANED